MNNKKTRGSNATKKQRQMLVECVKKNQLLLNRKQSQNYTQKNLEQDWQSNANILNAMPGANKNWKGWRKAWHDLRSRTKTKHSSNRRYANGTGGGELVEDVLSDVEEEVLQIIKKVSVEGHDVPEPQVEFEDLNFLIPEHQTSVTPQDTAEQQTFTLSPTTGILLPIEEKDNKPSPSTMTTTSPTDDRVCDKQNKNKKLTKKNLPKKVDHLINSAVAASAYQESLKRKLNIKESYYKEKIRILGEIRDLKSKKIEVLREIAQNIKDLGRDSCTFN